MTSQLCSARIWPKMSAKIKLESGHMPSEILHHVLEDGLESIKELIKALTNHGNVMEGDKTVRSARTSQVHS